MPIRVQGCAICEHSHTNACNVHVQTVMVSHGFATADGVHDQENMQKLTRPFSSKEVGSGNESMLHLNLRVGGEGVRGQSLTPPPPNKTLLSGIIVVISKQCLT